MKQLSPPIVFWSQNLDNRGQDLVVERNGDNWKTVSEGHDQQVWIERISKVREDGECLLKEHDLRVDFDAKMLESDSGRFLLDIETQKQDVAGRVSFFVCYGHAANVENHDWPDQILELIEEFGQKYDRLSAVERARLEDALSKIRDKKKALAVLRLMLLGAVGVAVGVGLLTWILRAL